MILHPLAFSLIIVLLFTVVVCIIYSVFLVRRNTIYFYM